MRFRKLLLVIGLALCHHLTAQEYRAMDYIADILSGDESKTDAAIGHLVAEQDEATFAFVSASVADRLYAVGNEAIEALPSGGYRILYPEVKEFKTENDEEVRWVKLSRRQKKAYGELASLASLSSCVASERIDAYHRLSTIGTQQSAQYLKHALTTEADSLALDECAVALRSILLFAGTDDEQREAVEYFAQAKDETAHRLLRDYLTKPAILASNAKAAKKAVAYMDVTERNNNIYQNIFSGLSLGSILIIVALGLSIIYGLAGVINMSHGEFLMIGAYTTYCMQKMFEAYLPASMFDWAFFLALPVSFVVTAAFGLVIERLVIRHLYSRPLESLLATWGISLILIQLARSIFGDLTTVKAPSVLTGSLQLSSGLILPYNRLFIIGLTIVLFVAVYLVFQKTRLGIKIRAVTQNRNMSACVGISTKKIDMTAFAIGSGLAGVAGCAITLIGNVVPDMGQTYIVDSFLVVVTGGVGKLAGCVASGLGLGILSKTFETVSGAVYGKVILLLIVIVFLQYRPKGLFPDKGRIGDD